MKTIIRTILAAGLLLIGLNTKAQEGYFAELNYKFGKTNMSGAYASVVADPITNTKTFTLHKDGFYQKNVELYFGYLGENIMYRGKVDGMFYAMADLASPTDPYKRGMMKNKFQKYEKLEASTPGMEKLDHPWYSNSVHPLSGAKDYKYFDFDLLFGNEAFKFGVNYAYGVMGANGGNNGTPARSMYRYYGAVSTNMGYQQYGLKTMVLNMDDLPIQATLSLNRIATVHSKTFDKRKGFGIDFEAKYYFSDSQFSPYIGVFYEFKKMQAMEEYNYYDGSIFSPIVQGIDPLKTYSFGIKVGFLVSE